MKRSQRGFTLVELIIVIAVIGVLAAILIPVFANVIKKANAKSALSDARNAVSLYVTEATERMTRGDDVPEHITLLVKKAGRYYVFGYDFNVSESIQVSNVNDEGGIEAADFNALVSGHSWNGLHAGTLYDPTVDQATLESYTVENDGAFYLVPYNDSGVSQNPNVRGFITSGGEKYRRLDDAEELNLSVGNSTEVYHGCLVGASFTTESSTGNTPGTDPGTDPGSTTTQYTVTLDLNGVDVDGYQTSYQVAENGSFTCNNPSATGKTFDGWKKNGTGANLSFPQTITENTTFVAQWSDVTHTITIDPTWSGNDITVTGIPAEFTGYTYDAPEGTDINAIVDVLGVSTDITGKDFLGWTINGTAYDSGVAHSLTADVTIAPVYGTTQLTVKFYNGTTEYTSLEMTVDYNDTITLPASPEADAAGAHYKGWKLNNAGDAMQNYPNPVTTNLEFYIVLGSYNVTFYQNDGNTTIASEPTNDVYPIPDTAAVAKTAPWYHSGWTVSSGATECAFSGSYTATSDNITVTAKLEDIVIIKFAAQENSTNLPGTDNDDPDNPGTTLHNSEIVHLASSSGAYTIPSSAIPVHPNPDDWGFYGYFGIDFLNNNITVTNTSTSVDSNIYAKPDDVITFSDARYTTADKHPDVSLLTVFLANARFYADAECTEEYTSLKRIPTDASNYHIEEPTAPNKTGYTFDFWALQGQTTAFNFTSTQVSQPIKLYAQWTPIAQSSVHEIYNEADFRKINSEAGWDMAEGTQYKLMADFSFSSNISGLGTSAAPFEAEFDGNGHTITVPSGVTLALGGNDAIFYVLGEHGVIKDLTVNWTTTTQVYATGAICCYNDGLIVNCKATGEMKVKTQSTSLRSAGGICFWNESTGIIRSCYSSMNLAGSYGLGGIAATNEGTIEMCGTTGNITPSGYTSVSLGGSTRRASTCGGIVSENTGTIDQCWSNVTITGNYALNGGLAGYVKANTSVISNCYFFGYVNAGGGSYGRLEGGLIGAVKYGTVRQCYCIGRVNAYNASDSWYTYGYKYNDGTWQGIYWHKGQLYQRGTQNTNYDNANTNPNDSGACGLAQSEWSGNDATFTGSGYSTSIWDFSTPYPTLINNPVLTGIEVKPYGMSVYIPPVVRSHEIATAADFLKIGVDSEWNMWDTYTVVNDIDFGGASIAPRGKSISTPFSGTFDGQGHKLYNFNFNVSTEGGLFFEVTGTVRNLWADTGTCTITGSSMGVIACYLDGSGKIEKCGASGTMSGTTFLGGVIDQITGSAVLSECWSNVTITSNSSQAQCGVILAACDGGRVENCVAFGSVSGGYSGGISGYTGTTTFVNVYNLSKVNDPSGTYSRPTCGYFGGSPTGTGIFFLKGMMYRGGTANTAWNTNSNSENMNGKGLTSSEFTTAVMTGYSTSIWDFSGQYPKLINAAGMASVTVAPPVPPVE